MKAICEHESVIKTINIIHPILDLYQKAHNFKNRHIPENPPKSQVFTLRHINLILLWPPPVNN